MPTTFRWSRRSSGLTSHLVPLSADLASVPTRATPASLPASLSRAPGSGRERGYVWVPWSQARLSSFAGGTYAAHGATARPSSREPRHDRTFSHNAFGRRGQHGHGRDGHGRDMNALRSDAEVTSTVREGPASDDLTKLLVPSGT